MASTLASLSLGLAPRTRCGIVRPALRARKSLVIRASDNPIEQIEEAGKNIAKETQKSSGLDPGVLGQQSGATKDSQSAGLGSSEVMSFSGLLPETINGRAAMVAMLAAFGAEVGSHRPVIQQVQTAPLLVFGAFALIVIGSVAPVLRNADLSVQGAGPFSQKAEIWNGRLAMVAFALLITVETWKRGPGLVP